MNSIIDTISSISASMDNLIDFIVTDSFLGGQFEKYLEKSKIEIQKESELNDVLINYLLEGKTETGEYVIDYYKEKADKKDDEILNSLKNSFISIFQVKKISKNAFFVYDLASEFELTLIPLVKTLSLKGIGLYDYIKGRVIELNHNFYILEIHDTISELKAYEANFETVKAIIKNPKIAVLHNREKLFEIKNSISSFHSSFLECFNKNEFVVSNKDADKILEDFYSFHTGKIDKIEYKPLDENFDYSFFEIEEYNNSVLINAVSGFSSSEKEYDIGFYSDFEFGFFVIPFLGTFNKILEANDYKHIKNGEECIKEFVLSDKISSNLLIEKEKQFGVLLEMINEIFNKKFDTIEDAVSFYKYEYKSGLRFSSVSVLYKSKAFEEVLGHKEEKQ